MIPNLISNLFKDKDSKSYTIMIDCSSFNIDSERMTDYFKYLETTHHITNLIYSIYLIQGKVSCYIQYNSTNTAAMEYFKDKCPSMIEKEINTFEKSLSAPIELVSDEVAAACYVTKSPLSEILTVFDENHKLIKPVIVMIPAEGDDKYHNKVKKGDGITRYDKLPYVYNFRIAIPDDMYTGEINAFWIKKFFIDLFKKTYGCIVFNNINVSDVKRTIFTECTEFILSVDPDEDFNNYLQSIDTENPNTQLYNELNIKLREFINALNSANIDSKY